MELSLFYHGTSASSARSIREDGFKFNLKAGGCTKSLQDKFGLEDKVSAQFHYFTTSLDRAAQYAKMHKQPDIVRVVLRDDWVQNDPEDPDKSTFRTTKKISSKLVLPKYTTDFTTKRQRSLRKRLNKGGNLKDAKITQKLTSIMQGLKKEGMTSDLTRISRSISPLMEEAKRDQETKDLLKAQGINIDGLRVGECVSVVFDD